MFDVMLAATHVVPRVETTLYTGWSSTSPAGANAFLQPVVHDGIVNAYKAKVTLPIRQIPSLCSNVCMA